MSVARWLVMTGDGDDGGQAEDSELRHVSSVRQYIYIYILLAKFDRQQKCAQNTPKEVERSVALSRFTHEKRELTLL